MAIHYTNAGPNPVRIVPFPMSGGKRMSGYTGTPWLKLPPGAGDTEASFFFEHAAVVDEVAVTMMDGLTITKTLNVPVHFTWTGPMAEDVPAAAPELPPELNKISAESEAKSMKVDAERYQALVRVREKYRSDLADVERAAAAKSDAAALTAIQKMREAVANDVRLKDREAAPAPLNLSKPLQKVQSDYLAARAEVDRQFEPRNRQNREEFLRKLTAYEATLPADSPTRKKIGQWKAQMTETAAQKPTVGSATNAPSANVVVPATQTGKGEISVRPSQFAGKSFEQCENVLGKPTRIEPPNASDKCEYRYYTPNSSSITQLMLSRGTRGVNGPLSETVNYFRYYFPKGKHKTWQEALASLGVQTAGLSGTGPSIDGIAGDYRAAWTLAEWSLKQAPKYHHPDTDTLDLWTTPPVK